MDLTQYNINQLVELRNEVNDLIHAYEDGYFYICNVSSYGRRWKEHVGNEHLLQELCWRYDGDAGIVNVYSNNPDLSYIDNYGDLRYVPTEDDYQRWKDYELLKRTIPELEDELAKWDARDQVPFRERPHFGPTHTWEDIAKYKKDLEEYDMSFTAPISYRVNNSEEPLTA